jgi:hypothetical protein
VCSSDLLTLANKVNRYLTTDLTCVTSQKSEDLSYIAAEVRNDAHKKIPLRSVPNQTAFEM